MAISLQSIFTLVVVDKNGLDLVESKQVSEQIIEANNTNMRIIFP